MGNRRSYPSFSRSRFALIGSTPAARMAALRAIVSLGLLVAISTGTLRAQTAYPTTTTISSSPNPASFTPPAAGAAVNLTATVVSPGGTVNEGTVTFSDGSATLGSSSVLNGTASLSTTLTEGTHQIVASYSDGTNFTVARRVTTSALTPPQPNLQRDQERGPTPIAILVQSRSLASAPLWDPPRHIRRTSS